MSSTPTTSPPARQADPAFEQQLREMNEALLLSAVRQQELAEQVEQANAVVRESEERYRNLFNSMDEGYCIIEVIFDEHERPVDYRFLEVNPSFEKQSGLHNATGKRMRELHSDLEEHWFETYGQIVLTGEPVRFVNEAKPMEGRWFDLYAFRIGGPGSRKVAVLFNDISERKKTQAALRESEQRYRNLFNSIDEGFCVIEMIFDEHEQPIDYRFLEVNPTFERQTGLRDAIGKRMRELRPNLEAHWFEIYGQVALTGETTRFVQEAKSMEGRWFDVYASRVGEPESRKVAIVFDDITERRQSEEALRQIERSLRFIMDSMPQKIFTATPNGDIDYFNPQWTEFTGMSFEQMADSGWTRFVHPDDLEEKALHWRHAFDTGEPFQSEHRFRRADGEYRWHISRALPMRDETGRITMWVGSNTDVHDMKQAEATLRRQAVQLSELHHRKDEFLAMLSHELRSPLAPIANAVQLLGLQKSGESRIQQQARGIIERQVGQLQHLVDDLLEVSRITTGRVQLRLERVDMCRIAEGAVETVRPLIEQRRHELTVSLPQEPVWMMADAARLEQVLVNLLTNASKYTEGGGHIWLTVELVARDEWRVARENSGGKDKSGEGRGASGEKEKAVGDILPIPDLTTHHSPLTTSAFTHDRATLPGTQGLAGSDEPGRALLPGDEKFPQGGTVRINQPDSSGGSVGASQHRGGAGTPAHEGIPEFSERGQRIADGGGNTLAAQSAGGPAQSNNAGFASNDVGGNQSDAVGPSTRAGETSGEWRVTGQKSGELRVTSGEEVEESDHANSVTPLTTHHSPLATPCVVIRVRDTGVGISPALLPHVFDLFTQADRSLDRSQGGLGIGLALVQRLTELHGGQVEAFSTIGEGSEFVVRLPVQSDELRVTSGESQHSSSLTTHHSPLATPLKVLVVDDNVDTVLGFSMLLKASGHDVRTAHDGLSAVEVAIDYRPDVVLLDIGLPGLNGYEVAKRLRQHSDLQNTVLIALTGYGQDTDRQTSQQAGFNHHLVKPARFEQLNKILTTVQEGLKV